MNVQLYDRLKTGAVLFERAMGLVEVSGPDRVPWLQGMVTNDVEGLRAGEGCYAAHLSPQGKVLSQMLVLVRDDSLWLQLERSNVEAAVGELNKLLIMEDAEIEDRSSEFATLTIAGAGARSALAQWSGAFESGALYGHQALDAVWVVRADVGYDLIMSPEDASRVGEALAAGGAVLGDSELWECMRIEAGLPAYGIDVDSTTTLPELGERGIDYQKGCYIGQEVVAKIRYIGHVNRRFVGVKLSGAALPDRGAKLRQGEREVGRTTSRAYSPGLESAIALGYVRRGVEAPGTEVELTVDGVRQVATVADLPFVSHQY